MKRKNLVALAISLILIANLCSAFAATETIGALRWSNTGSISVSLNFTNSTAYCTTTIIGMSGTSKIYGTMTLYKKVGSTWEYVKHWTGDEKSDILSISGSQPSCTSKSVYKLLVDAEVYRNGSWEYPTVESEERTCP